MLLSIIIPCYNAEPWMARCLDSILSQGVDDMEIIAVNDGSKDRTLEILRDYASRYPAIVKVIDKPNGGVSSARNAGLDIAQGEYIMFVDADDQLVEGALVETIRHIDKMYSTDLIYVGMQLVSEGKIISRQLYDNVRPWNKVPFFISQILHTTYSSPCSKFYRRVVIINNNIRFRQDKRMYEDTFFNNDILSCNPTIGVIGVPLYQYNMLPYSSSRKFFGNEIIETIEELRQHRMKYFIEINGMESMKYDINRDASFMYLFAIYSIYRSKGTKQKKYWLTRYWNAAQKNDSNWSLQLDSGIPKITGILGRKSKLMCHWWLSLVFGAEKTKKRLKK